jgi:hypothetical protein
MVYPSLENFARHKGIFEVQEVKLYILSLFDITSIGDIVVHNAYHTQQCHAFFL